MRRAMVGMGLVFAVAACGAQPAPQFMGAQRHDIQIEGYRFAVFQKDDQAEVIRLGYLTRAERLRVPALMVVAVERTTGCDVVDESRGPWRSPRLVGDTGEARFQLRCAEAAAARGKPLRR